MRFLHDSRDAFYRAPCGAQPCGAEVTLRLRVLEGTPDKLHLRLWFGKESFHIMKPVTGGEGGLYEAAVCLPETPCLLWYDFQIWKDGQFYWYGNAEDSLGGKGALVFGCARSFQITVYDPAFETPEWTRGAVFYQIFPDRFARGSNPGNVRLPKGYLYHEDWADTPSMMFDPETGDNVAHDFFGGTLNGIREKLPYIASLGVTGLYLNPIFHGHTNHRFDTTDWLAIDPLLGTEEDFRALCEEARALDIHIVLDGVFSHSGNANPFFRHAREVPDSPYRNWYLFEHWPDMYKSWWGFTTLPELNKRQPEVIDYFLCGKDAVVKKWLAKGADGWRIDVADELPMEYLKMLRSSAKQEKAEAVVIGEVWEDASNKVSYGEMRCYCLGDTLDGVMNYPLREAAISFLTGKMDAPEFKRRMDSLYENYPAPFQRALLNVIGSHDRPRTLNVLAGADGDDLPREERGSLRLSEEQRLIGRNRLMLMLEIIVAMPGMPCVYYGDEAGMEGAADPFCRGTFPWGKEDAELTAFFRRTLKKRGSEKALWDGALAIDAPHADVLVIRRVAGNGTYALAVNRGGKAREIALAGQAALVPAFGCVALNH